MTKKSAVVLAVVAALALAALGAGSSSDPVFLKRTIMLAHNAYASKGGGSVDLFEEALNTGLPVALEVDLAWLNDPSGKSHTVLGGPRTAAAGDPTFENYVIPRMKPIVEKALKEGNKGNWPLITLYLDFKLDEKTAIPVLEELNKTLDEYDTWISFAPKPSNDTVQTALQVRPLLLLCYDKTGVPIVNVKREFYYDRVPVGGKVRVFGSVRDPAAPAGLSRDAANEFLYTQSPEQVLNSKADTYRRWFFMRWMYIEKGGVSKAGDWTKEDEARLNQFVKRAKDMGYWVSPFTLGYLPAGQPGFDKDYHFASIEAAQLRWKAALRAKVNFIQTDTLTYKALTDLLKAGK